jgi:hypothetical protein
MTTKFVLAGVGFAIGIAFALDVGPAIAKGVAIKGTHSRAEISTKCKAVGGMETGTTPGTTGGYACYNGDKGWVECNDKGKCVGSPPAKPSNPAANQPRPAPQGEIEAILGGS